MVLKRLKLHQVFDGVARTFSDTQVWVSEGGQECENFSENGKFLSFECGKNQISPLLAPLEKRLEKSTSAPLVKNPSDVHAHKHVKFHHFCENYVAFHHLAILFNNANTLSKPRQSDRLWTVYSAKH